MNIEELEKLIDEKVQKRAELVKQAEDYLEGDELEKAKETYDKIKSLDEEIKKYKKQLEELKANQPQEGDEPEVTEARNLDLNRIEAVETPEESSQETRDFQHYLETRDIPGGSLTTESGFVVIPEEIVNDILTLKEKEYNLDQYVTVKNVTNGSGKYPVVRQSQVSALPEVEELADNPELAVKPFFQLAYDIKTHRGYFLVAREAIEDAKVNVLNELKQWMARTIASTRNAGIVNILKNGGYGEAGAKTKLANKTVHNVDEIKETINKNILPNYEHNVAIVSQSAWAVLDNLKDKQGNYLVQPDIKEPSARRLLGARVEVLPDEFLGKNGANTIIIGNLKDAVVLFNRSQYQAGWTNYMQFGEALMVAVRQDVRLLDDKAAIILTLDLQEETANTAG